MSAHWQYYVLLFLFSVLFVLQVWAIIKIRQMVRQVLRLYDQFSRKPARTAVDPKAVGTFRHTCQICRHRQTFLDPTGEQVFVYRCGLSRQRILLDDYCEKFEFDPHIADI